MRFAFIHAEGAKLPTSLLCRALKVSRSGFYAWSKRPPSRRDVEDSKLVPVIRACHAQSRATYGSPRVHKDLQALSYRVSRKRVARLMRREGLSARPPRRYRATTDSKHSLAIAPNVVAREFHAAAPNRVWVTDMTYIWTWEGWLFLAAIVDVFSRRVVGWAMADHLRTELPLEALGMALGMRQPERGLVHHSDRGCQYASELYRAELSARGIVCSMIRRPRLHRGVLQSAPASLVPRLRQPDGLRTATGCRDCGSIAGPSTKTGQLQRTVDGPWVCAGLCVC
jgi:putative transposase